MLTYMSRKCFIHQHRDGHQGHMQHPHVPRLRRSVAEVLVAAVARLDATAHLAVVLRDGVHDFVGAASLNVTAA